MGTRSYAVWNRLQSFSKKKVRAIEQCARASLMEGVSYHSIVIFLDSRSTLMAQDGFLITSKEVLKCGKLLEELAVS